MRSEHNLSPEQLWTAGLNSMAGSSSRIASEVFENMSEVRSTICVIWPYMRHHSLQVDHELEALRMLCVSLGNTHIA